MPYRPARISTYCKGPGRDTRFGSLLKVRQRGWVSPPSDHIIYPALCIKRTRNPESLTSGFRYPASMQDKTIDNALRALCKAGGEQGELAGRLLVMRGIDMPEPPRYPKNAARHRETRQLVLAELR